MKFLTMIISVIALSFGLQTAMAKSMEDQDAMLAFGSTAESEVIVLAALEMEETTGAWSSAYHRVYHYTYHAGKHRGTHWHANHGYHWGKHKGAHSGTHQNRHHY